MAPKKLVRISASMPLSGSTNVPLCAKYLLQSSEFKLPLLAHKQRLVFNLEMHDLKQGAALTKRVLSLDRAPPPPSEATAYHASGCLVLVGDLGFEKNEGTEDAWERTGVMNGGDRQRVIYKGFHFLPVSVPLPHALPVATGAPSLARSLASSLASSRASLQLPLPGSPAKCCVTATVSEARERRWEVRKGFDGRPAEWLTAGWHQPTLPHRAAGTWPNAKQRIAPKRSFGPAGSFVQSPSRQSTLAALGWRSAVLQS